MINTILHHNNDEADNFFGLFKEMSCPLCLEPKQNSSFLSTPVQYWAPLPQDGCTLPGSGCAGNLHRVCNSIESRGHRLLGTVGSSRPSGAIRIMGNGNQCFVLFREFWIDTFYRFNFIEWWYHGGGWNVTQDSAIIVQCWGDWWRQLLKYNLGLIFSELQSRELWQQIKISDHFLKYPPNEFWF